MEIQARRLVFHSAVVLVIGVLCGVLLTTAITYNWPADSEQSWRIPHRSLLLGGALALAVAGLLSSLDVAPARKGWIALWFVISNYAFSFGLLFGALTHQRGVFPMPPWQNWVALIGNFTGAFGGLIGAVLLLHAAWVSLRGSAK